MNSSKFFFQTKANPQQLPAYSHQLPPYQTQPSAPAYQPNPYQHTNSQKYPYSQNNTNPYSQSSNIYPNIDNYQSQANANNQIPVLPARYIY